MTMALAGTTIEMATAGIQPTSVRHLLVKTSQNYWVAVFRLTTSVISAIGSATA